MKILYFTRDYSVHDARFVRALSDHGYQVLLLRLEGLAGLTELPPGVKDIDWLGTNLPYRFQLANSYVQALRRIWREHEPDVVHAGPLNLSGYMAACAELHPLVSMSWGSDLLWYASKSWFDKNLIAYTLKRSDVLIADCQAVKHAALKLGFSEDRIVLFPWGVDLELFSPALDRSIRMSLNWQNEFVLFSNRSWEPIYGVDVLLKAFHRALKSFPALRLILAGTGSEEKKMKRYIEKNSLHGFVHLPGRISQQELPSYYRNADCFVSASHCDGSSVSLLEAMACAKPVIVSNIAGNAEWIEDGRQGFLFKDNSAPDLAEKMIAMANCDETRLMQMQSENHRMAQASADWSRNSAGIMEAYGKAVKHAGSKSS